MTPLARIRDAALILPETEEREKGGATVFAVAGKPFARVGDDGLRVREGVDGGWASVSINEDADWALVEDRIARGWELAAPRRLLEAGGR